MASNSRRRRGRPGFRLPLWLSGLLIILFLVLLVGSSFWLFRAVRNMAASGAVSEPAFSPVVDDVSGRPAAIGEPAVNVVEASGPFVSAEALKGWTGNDRVNLLLLGVDQRCEELGPTHTDSLMVLTVDPVGLSAAILSLPRDLWIEVPGFGVDRINQAYYLGEIYEYPGGGQALAVETVEATLGIELDYFVTVNFQAFVEAVDLIGGIEVDVPAAIHDPSYPDRCYGYDPFDIDAGRQRLDGATALKYARTRATFGGDVDRASRQQLVILGVRDRISQVGMIPQLIGQAPQLWQTYQENVRTNLTLDEAIQLSLLLQDIPRESIHTAIIDYTYVYNEITPDGRQVLVPIRDEIRSLRNELFAPPAVPTPVIPDLAASMADERARVAVYNGTAVFGLAAATRDYLLDNGVNVTGIGNADSASYGTTQIIDFGSHPQTAQFLVRLMEIPPLNVSSGQEPDGDYDLLIIIGDDWRVPES